MTDIQPPGTFGRSRSTGFGKPTLHQPAQSLQPDAPAEETAQPLPVQHNAAAVQQLAGIKETHAAAPDQPPSLKDEEFKVSVDDIRLRLEAIGISKSKDTIQRYCRDGLLDCDKFGLMRRYFATETSVEKLISTLEKDATASDGTQVHTGAADEKSSGMKLHAAEQPNEPKRIQVHAAAVAEKTSQPKEPDEPAPSNMKVHAAAREKKSSDVKRPEREASSTPLELELRTQIKDKDAHIAFLQDELRDRRTQTKALEMVIQAFKDNAETSKIEALRAAQEQEQKTDTASYSAQVLNDNDDEAAVGNSTHNQE